MGQAMGYEIFEDLCKRKGVKAAEVARQTGVSTSTISAWKQGQYTPKADKLQKIADYFGVTPEYLTTGEVREGYYLNPETARVAQELFENPKMRILFDAARDADPEDLQMAADMLYRLKAKTLGLDNDEGC